MMYFTFGPVSSYLLFCEDNHRQATPDMVFLTPFSTPQIIQ